MAAVIKISLSVLTVAAIQYLSDSPAWKDSVIQQLCKVSLAEKMKAGADESDPSSPDMNKAQTSPDGVSSDLESLGEGRRCLANKPDGSEVTLNSDGQTLVFEQKDAVKMNGLGWPILLIRYDVESIG